MPFVLGVTTIFASFGKIDLLKWISDPDTAKYAIDLMNRIINISNDMISKAGYVPEGRAHFKEVIVDPVVAVRDKFSLNWDAKIQAAEKKYIEEYWKLHATEKKMLDETVHKSEHSISGLNTQIDEINRALEHSSEKTAFINAKNKKESIEEKIKQLGLFKRKEKAKLNDKLKLLEKEYSIAKTADESHEESLMREKQKAEKSLKEETQRLKNAQEKIANPPKQSYKR